MTDGTARLFVHIKRFRGKQLPQGLGRSSQASTLVRYSTVRLISSLWSEGVSAFDLVKTDTGLDTRANGFISNDTRLEKSADDLVSTDVILTKSVDVFGCSRDVLI